MTSNVNYRRLAMVVAIAGAALLQACAVTTGPYTADRSAIVSHSMVSRYDFRFQHQSSGGSALHMPSAQPGGLFYFRY